MSAHSEEVQPSTGSLKENHPMITRGQLAAEKLAHLHQASFVNHGWRICTGLLRQQAVLNQYRRDLGIPKNSIWSGIALDAKFRQNFCNAMMRIAAFRP